MKGAYIETSAALFLLILPLTICRQLNTLCPSREWIEESFNKSLVPGAALLVVNATHTLYREAFGYHSLSPPRYVDVEKSIFTLASLSKTFIAVAIMQLVERELVDLDTDIKYYLNDSKHSIFHPKYPSHAITLRKLLSHSSSILVDGNTQASFFRPEDQAFEEATLSKFLFTYISPNTTFWIPKPPGSVTQYSNEGSALAALVVERVTNLSFDRYVKEQILAPLNVDIRNVGIRSTDFSNRDNIVQHYSYVLNESQYQTWREGLPQLNMTLLETTYPSWMQIQLYSLSAYPTGMLRMSGHALSAFLQMVMSNGSSLISARSVAEMKLVVGGGLIPEYRASERGLPPRTFGLSWQWRRLSDGRLVWGHTGTLFGARHAIVVNEENTLGIIILSNGDANLPSNRSIEYHYLLESLQLALFRCFDSTDTTSIGFYSTISTITFLMNLLFVFIVCHT